MVCLVHMSKMPPFPDFRTMFEKFVLEKESDPFACMSPYDAEEERVMPEMVVDERVRDALFK